MPIKQAIPRFLLLAPLALSIALASQATAGASVSQEARPPSTGRSSLGETPDELLRRAAEAGDLPAVREALKRRADPDYKPRFEKNANAAIALAVRNGHADVVDALLEAGASPSGLVSGPNGGGLLEVAAAGGSTRIVRSLLETRGSSYKPGHLDPALHKAANAEVAELLLKAGAQAGGTFWGRSPLHAASQRGDVKLIALLLRAGAYVDAPSVDPIPNSYDAMRKTFGQTPLFYAARSGSTAAMKQLLDAGADSNARDNQGRSPLHFAGSVEAAELLLAAGADIGAKDDAGWPPLIEAPTVALADFYISKGMKIDAAAARSPDPLRMLPLHRVRNARSAEALLKAGAEFNAIVGDLSWRRAPIHSAVIVGDIELVAVLLKAGADIESRTEGGSTPLHFAANWGTVALVKLLLDAGADPRAQNSNGETPHNLAKGESRDLLWNAMMEKPLK
jgi:cytohesin